MELSKSIQESVCFFIHLNYIILDLALFSSLECLIVTFALKSRGGHYLGRYARLDCGAVFLAKS